MRPGCYERIRKLRDTSEPYSMTFIECRLDESERRAVNEKLRNRFLLWWDTWIEPTLGKYRSKRGIDLIITDSPQRPTITVENYCKWYDLYLVDANETRVFEYSEYEDVVKDFSGTVWGDHVINPKFVQELCLRRNLVVDPRAFEVMVGRWVIEHDNTY